MLKDTPPAVNIYWDPASGITSMLILAVPSPYAFVAVTVYDVADCVAVGVPLIAHEVALSERPAGNVGDEVHDVGVLPPSVGVIVVIAESCVKVNGESV
jgi:hypothetical protein